ncbi:nicotinamide riboside transporter PnuC [Acetobacter orleanensis]|uniref:Nicotinamide riboside transporter PnuC n=1 Tax=Acetobacter orleanensis TaxID=104099 RepID=A0A4Y3TGY9_9PROT|nr:nicotinamide riboside transporter PnuC [Acetobacter orleanensis]KXV63931.1 aminotransferase [Acetobacter orleanensis]PCD79702.1 aminotransferase [Acetobacter orleanensis]GAN69263.1 transporter of nicotinamide mononucleotide PnuC [Acetobacter orleanensis JCM 7639]GBR28221.1 transporter of nicotinamide mononucleotide PnuC [Acetobacter orleanensis NRIC 0473]GEB82211.1 aminotransferase [Acetobacter orleanensis]
MSLLEVLAVLFSAAGVWLTGRRLMLCWPVMLVASVLYGVVFWQAHLYADTALQGVFAALSLYGWWGWLRGVAHDGAVWSVQPPRNAVVGGVALGLVAGLLMGAALLHWTDDPNPILDALLSAFSILGQVWMARRYLVSWVVWLVVDVLYTGLFVVRELYLTAGLYAAFVALAVAGWVQWRAADAAEGINAQRE